MSTKKPNTTRSKTVCQLVDPEEVDMRAVTARIGGAAGTDQSEALKASIVGSGGLTTPVHLRLAAPDSAKKYELVSGLLRATICEKEKLPLLAMVISADAEEAFLTRHRDNLRAELSPWELGRQYLAALDSKIFSTQSALAAAVGRDEGGISKLLAMARVPEAVVQAFAAPKDLQHRWVRMLVDAHKRQPDALMTRASELAANRGDRTPKQILDALLNTQNTPSERGMIQEVAITIGSRTAGKLVLQSDGSVTMAIDGVELEWFRRLVAALESWGVEIAVSSGKIVPETQERDATLIDTGSSQTP